MNPSLLSCTTFIFDLDGCVWFGNTPAAGAREVMSLLRKTGRQPLFLSNNSTHEPRDIQAKLAAMGIPAAEEEIYLASTLTGMHIRDTRGPSRICVCGSEGLARELTRFGHDLVALEADDSCDVLVMGRDFCFSYDRLRQCIRRIEQGATFYATNRDTYQPALSGGREPETGSLALAVSAVTGAPSVSVGKPHPYAFQAILERRGLSRSECLMVGDNPDTDIAGANEAGIASCRITLGHAEHPEQAKAACSLETMAEFSKFLHQNIPGAPSEPKEHTWHPSA